MHREFLPLDELKRDQSRLKIELDRIGTLLSLPHATSGRPMMSTIHVFDPAMCCSTGVCGVDVDQQLVSFAADLDWARQNGAQIERFNLAQQPQVFARSAVVSALLASTGLEALPVIVVDGKFAFAGAYPSRAQLGAWAGIALQLRPNVVERTGYVGQRMSGEKTRGIH